MSLSPSNESPRPAGFTPALRSAFRPYAPYLFAVFASLLVWHIGVQILYFLVDGPGLSGSDRAEKFAFLLIFRLIIFFALFWLVKLVTIMLTGHKLPKGTPLLRFPTDPVFWVQRLALATIAVISFVWLQTNFMSVKTAIPAMAPFYLDEAARDWDRALFFGRDPYTLFAPLFEHPDIMRFIDKLYTNWAALIAGIWMLCFVSQSIPRVRRFQYIFAMLLMWFLAGNVMATFLSSAGPCYYEAFTGDAATYAPLLSQLSEINDITKLGAYEYHAVLLDMYNNPNTRFGGISAMPSLHVGTSLIMLMMFWNRPILRVLLIVFNIIIYIGSIVLAWHYAVDGLIAIPPALFCWWLGGKIARRLEARNTPVQST